MATTREGKATWAGNLTEGSGTTTLATSDLGSFDLTWKARSEDAVGKTIPEELIGAAHAGCYAMAFSNAVVKAGYEAPTSVETSAAVDFVPGKGITEIRLTLRASIEGIEADAFAEIAEAAKNGCPVSQALASVPSITLDAKLT